MTATLASLGTAFLASEVGCVRGKRRFWARRKKKDPTTRLSQTETVLRVDGRVERMEIAKNSKRILIELRDFDDFAEDAYADFFASGGRRTETKSASDGVFELWNVEFLEARREAFDLNAANAVESATFDDSGARVFWTTREIERLGAFASLSGGGTQDEKRASTAEFRGFATANVENAEKRTVGETSETRNDGTKIALASATVSAERTSWGIGNASRQETSVFEPATRTVLATRAFGGTSASNPDETEDASATRLKISEAAKGAESVWLSPNARWIVGRVGRNGEMEKIDKIRGVSGEGEREAIAQNGEGLTIGEWALTLRRDRRRVVRFPNSVKMTFAELTSNETIEGRVVDVLAVSNAGDLVATLVEETPSNRDEAKSNETNGFGEVGEFSEVGGFDGSEESAGEVLANEAEFDEQTDFIPRFKIVIWDLSVPETVDWEKAKKPLQALEVAQIAVAGPVSRRFCRFSPNGQIFASRIDPRYVSLWQAANGRLLVELGEHESDVSDFAFSPNGMKAAAATGTGKRVLLWNIRKGAAHRTLQETASEVASIDAVAFSSDGGSVFFANDFGEIKRWDARAEGGTTKAEKG